MQAAEEEQRGHEDHGQVVQVPGDFGDGVQDRGMAQGRVDEEEADELAKNWASYPDVKAIYAANDILFTTEQAELFAGTEINIIPDYYFEFELREEGETW